MAGAVFALLFWTAVITTIVYFVVAYMKSHKRKKKEELEGLEKKRLRECEEVVLFFAENFGYIAKQCISREELEELIDGGISPEDLALEISTRMDLIDGLVLGYQTIGEAEIPVKLTQHYRDRHIYIVGKTGSGKTNLMRNLIYQDISSGRGVGVIAPEQEMITEEILPFIPEERIDDVIYFNPADTEHPVCFNPLQLDEGEDIDLKVDENLTIFKRIIDVSSGPRMEEILRQSLYALIEKDGTTLLDVERLLDRDDPTFRNEVVRESRDEATVHFFRDVYPKMPKDAHLPITTRLSRLLRPKFVRNILCQPYSTFNFRKAIDEGKILLFNLSDGILGEITSQIIGQLIVAKFQLALMSRADVPKSKRTPFYLYIDEFQTFTSTAASSYEKILSRARKYSLSLTLAHQQTGQIPSELLKEILGNVSTIVVFNVGRDDASRLSKELITSAGGEVVNIPPEELLQLKVGQAYCRIGQNSFFMQTHPAPSKPDRDVSSRVIERSRRNYGVKITKSPAPSRLREKRPREKFEDIDPGKVF